MLNTIFRNALWDIGTALQYNGYGGGSFCTWNLYGSKASGVYCVASREFSTLGQSCFVVYW